MLLNIGLSCKQASVVFILNIYKEGTEKDDMGAFTF